MTGTVSGSGKDSGVTVVLQGRITAYTAAPIWRAALETLTGNPNRPVVVDASRLEYVDDVGIALLFDLIRRDRPADAKVEIRELAPNLAALVRGYNPKDFAAPARDQRRLGILEHVGRATTELFAYAKQMAGFIAACSRAFRQVLTNRGALSWRDVLDVATEAGANAVPIVLLT